MADKDWKIEFPVNKGMKSYLASFLSEIELEQQIAERIRLGKLQEADLFYLKEYLSDHFYFRGREYCFRLAR